MTVGSVAGTPYTMPSQVQLAGESNGLSPGSLSLDGNGAQSGSLITTESVKQVCPRMSPGPC